MFSRVAGSGLIALLLATAPLAAQQRVLTGRVVGAQSKRPIAEASVVVVGGAGARTSGDGKFNVPAPAGQVQLTIRAIGFVRKTLAVSATDANLEIELAEDIFRLEEIVTTGQATSITKRNATTASVTVEAEDLTRAPAISLDQALQGKVPGAQVFLNGGGPGGGAQIQIRGASSILGNSQPLFILVGAEIGRASCRERV